MKYAKGVTAAIGGLCTVLTGVFADNVIGTDEWGTLAAAVAVATVTVVRVVQVENAK